MAKALYPGSFDPVTLGHVDLVERALKLFEQVTVAIAHNADKRPLFTTAEREDMLRLAMPRHPGLQVTHFEGLAVEFCKHTGHGVILRGLRTVSDFEFEYQMALTNRHLAEQIETAFVMPSARFAFISSSLIKDVVRHGGDVSAFLPREVEKRLRKRLEERESSK
jgi:pantetheine-phosphate adenylyltransferase